MSRQFYVELQNSLESRFGRAGFSFLDRAYLVDWVVASIMWFTAFLIKELPPFERDFDKKDPLISHEHKKNQISGNLNWTLAFIVPIAITLVAGLRRRSAIEVHHSLLALYSGRGLCALITEALKNRVGRLRPDFLERCKLSHGVCTGNDATVQDGRRSFPSGHSSEAFAGMTFLSLWIAGMTGAWCLSQPVSGSSFLRSKIARLAVSLAPLAFATWVAVSRVEDYRHHKEDVIVGSLLGIASATICYLIYWPNPFSYRPYTARVVYGGPDAEVEQTRANPERYGYELTGLDHDQVAQSV